MEVIRFIFSSFWIWLGTLFLVAAVLNYAAEIIKAARSRPSTPPPAPEEEERGDVETGNLLVRVWHHMNKTHVMDTVDTAFRSCPVDVQEEILQQLFDYAEHGFVDEAYFDSGLCDEVRKRLNIW